MNENNTVSTETATQTQTSCIKTKFANTAAAVFPKTLLFAHFAADRWRKYTKTVLFNRKLS